MGKLKPSSTAPRILANIRIPETTLDALQDTKYLTMAASGLESLA